MTSNRQKLTSEKKPLGLPRWLMITWFIIFPLAFLLIARFVYEQTYLTWVGGLQMVGFTLAHQGLGFLVPGMLALGLTHVWLLIVVMLIAVSRRYRQLSKFQAAVTAATVLTLLLNYVPYLWWQRILVRIPGSHISERDLFVEAAGQGRLGTVKSYLSHVDLKTINQSFFGTCVAGRVPMMNFLLTKGADVNFIGDDLGETPLMAAAQMGHAEAVKILLGHGADPNVKGKDGKTALSLALEYNHPEIATILQQRGAKASILDAASAGDTEAVRALLRDDPKAVSAKDPIGFSTLYHAAEGGHREAAAALLAAGANANDFTGNNGWGYSPLLIAAEKGHADVVALLIDHGADVNSRSRNKESALWLAARNGHLEVAEVLLAHSADINIKGLFMDTPLGEAAYSGSKGIAELLIAHKADLNVRDEHGFTPLHMAAYHGHADVVESLLAAGADINANDKDGKTALDQARSRGETKTTNLLRRHGAKE